MQDAIYRMQAKIGTDILNLASCTQSLVFARSEGDIVVRDSGIAESLIRIGCGPGHGFHRLNTRFGSLLTAAQENHVAGYYLSDPPLVAVSIRVFACLDASLDVDLLTFGEKTFAQIRQLIPSYHIVPFRALLAGSALVCPIFAGGKTEGRDRSLVRGVPDFGILSQTADEQNFI